MSDLVVSFGNIVYKYRLLAPSGKQPDLHRPIRQPEISRQFQVCPTFSTVCNYACTY